MTTGGGAQGVVRLLRLRRLPILRQLLLEEALLRADRGNWCLVNSGTPDPAIVLGLAGRPEQLIDLGAALGAGVPAIRRFSGGGTVVVDEGTRFVTLILQAAALPGVGCYPRPIMAWSAGLYRPLFGRLGDFRLREQDYAIGEQKFGGNAQAITKERWLHHTSFLWDFQPGLMALLQQPDKAPAYRQGRGHLDFVRSLRQLGQPDGELEGALGGLLERAGFSVVEASLGEAEVHLEKEYLRSTRLVDLREYLPRGH